MRLAVTPMVTGNTFLAPTIGTISKGFGASKLDIVNPYVSHSLSYLVIHTSYGDSSINNPHRELDLWNPWILGGKFNTLWVHESVHMTEVNQKFQYRISGNGTAKLFSLKDTTPYSTPIKLILLNQTSSRY